MISINLNEDPPRSGGPRRGRRASRGRPGRGAPLLFVPMFLAGAAVLVLGFVRPLKRSLALEDWRAVPCVIASSRLDRGRPAIEYLYQVGPKTYRSGRIALYPRAFSAPASARELVERYPAGKSTDCYVNPADPTDAVLSRDPVRDALVLAPAGLLALVVMVTSVLAGFGLFRRLAAWLQLPGFAGD